MCRTCVLRCVHGGAGVVVELVEHGREGMTQKSRTKPVLVDSDCLSGTHFTKGRYDESLRWLTHRIRALGQRVSGWAATRTQRQRVRTHDGPCVGCACAPDTQRVLARLRSRRVVTLTALGRQADTCTCCLAASLRSRPELPVYTHLLRVCAHLDRDAPTRCHAASLRSAPHFL